MRSVIFFLVSETAPVMQIVKPASLLPALLLTIVGLTFALALAAAFALGFALALALADALALAMAVVLAPRAFLNCASEKIFLPLAFAARTWGQISAQVAAVALIVPSCPHKGGASDK